MGQGAYGLGASYPVDFGYPQHFQCTQERKRHFASGTGGSYDRDFGNSSYLGQGHRHDDRGNQRDVTPRNIDPNPPDGKVFLSHLAAVIVTGGPIRRNAFFMKKPYVSNGFLNA